MATLRLLRIECNSTTSGWGDDDILIKIDGQPFWGGDHKEVGDGETLQIEKDWSFSDRAKVVVWEWDEGDDDLIGGFSVKQSTPKNREFSAKMNGDGSNYDIYYIVS